ncbi:MAG: hydroxymethylbilane synthase [Firmicutes bacterium]|nr:hydroxymethylbilane synthase [Bacillota bacterium]
MKREIIIGTRESGLAMWQAKWVCSRLQELNPDYSFTIKGMKTTGDNILDVALAKIGDKGLFTKELELALQRKEIDMAVHSMKDLPTKLPPGLIIGAISPREYPGDVLVSTQKVTLDKLPLGARIGTSSLRRRAQLLKFRPDLEIVTVRGNINTRIRKIEEQNLHGIILAYAGVYRMGFEDMIAQKIPFSICLPAVGQGAMGLEIRDSDPEIVTVINKLDSPEARHAISAERALMKKLEGGCQVPIGALANIEGSTLTMEAVVASLDGKESIRLNLEGPVQKAWELGDQLAQRMLDIGAGEILEKARQENDIDD